MIFLVTYKEDIEAVFFHIWDAQQHINFFSKEEQDQMEIVRIDEHDVKELQGLKDLLQTCNKLDNHKILRALIGTPTVDAEDIDVGLKAEELIKDDNP